MWVTRRGMQCGEEVEDPGDDGRVGRRTAVAANWQPRHWGKGRRDRAFPSNSKGLLHQVWGRGVTVTVALLDVQ